MRIFGFLILAFGAVLAVGGVKLASLGGSPYYLLVGITLILSGALTIAGRVAGLYVYFFAFLATLVWSLFEAGLDGWALVPRLVGPFILLVLALLVMPARLLNGKPTRRAYGAGLTVILALGLVIAVPLAKAPVATLPVPVVPDGTVLLRSGDSSGGSGLAHLWRRSGRSTVFGSFADYPGECEPAQASLGFFERATFRRISELK